MKEKPPQPAAWASARAWQNWEDAYAHWVDYERWQCLENEKNAETTLNNTGDLGMQPNERGSTATTN